MNKASPLNQVVTISMSLWKIILIRRRMIMTYEQAFEYLQELDTVPYCDSQFTDAINKAQDALRDCLELGLSGED